MGAQKQKNALNCNFFAIGDCCGAPKRVSRRKSAANRLIGSQFVLCTDKRESAIAKKLHGRRIICFRNGKITITERILKRDADKRARIPLAGADGERTPASAATDIGHRCSGAVNGTRLAAQRAAATGGRQQWHRTYTSKSARALQVSMMTRKVRACASKSASGVLTAQPNCAASLRFARKKGLAIGKPLKLVHIVKREGIVCITITGEILRCG